MSDLFARPECLPLLLLAPLAYALLVARDRARARRRLRAFGPRESELAPDPRPAETRLRRALLAAALALALLAAAAPLIGEGPVLAPPRGADVVVALDVSRSMLARDVPPTRLERARREIRALASRARGDRLSLVLFAGEARLVAPLTEDASSFAEILDLADETSVARGGTDLGAAIEASLAALAGATGDHAAIVLVTDGEDLEAKGLRAAAACAERGITVHAVGIGSAIGSKIAVEGEGGETFLRDATGREVVSAMDPESLRRIAAATGGEFVDAGSLPEPLAQLHERRIVPMARRAFEAGEERERVPRFQWPLALAIVLLLAELALAERRKEE